MQLASVSKLLTRTDPSTAFDLLEIVVMLESLKPASDHRVPKVNGPLPKRNARVVLMTEAKMARLPDHLLAETQNSGRFASDRTLSRILHGSHMKIDIERKIETPLRGGGNEGEHVDA